MVRYERTPRRAPWTPIQASSAATRSRPAAKMAAQALAQKWPDSSSVVLPSALTLRAISSAHSWLPPSEFKFDHFDRDNLRSFILNVIVNMGIDLAFDDQGVPLDVRRDQPPHSIQICDAILGRGRRKQTERGPSGALARGVVADTDARRARHRQRRGDEQCNRGKLHLSSSLLFLP